MSKENHDRIRIGVSACLLGEEVRYDGQHKLDRFIRDTLGQFMEFVPVCPEVECGLPVPREAMRLVGDPEQPRLVTVKTHQDLTAQMQEYARERVAELEEHELCGFIFKSKSPSSGLERVKVYPSEDGGMPARTGVGLFAREFVNHFPLVPVEDDGRLHDIELRENFLERVFAVKRWRDMRKSCSPAALQEFHARHKLLLMAHSPGHYKELGRLAAEADKESLCEVCREYLREFTQAMKTPATKEKHVNVLQHILGYFKRDLTADEKKEMLEIINNFRRGYVPLIVPVTLLNHYVRKFHAEYLKTQVYLNPHPKELQLRNHC